MEPGWHLYSLTTPPGGPIPTTVSLADNPAIDHYKIYQPKPEKKFDPNFQLDTETFGGQAIFLLDIDFKKDAPAGATDVVAQVRYQCCNDRLCLPPKRKTASASIAVDPTLKSGTIGSFVPDSYSEVKLPSGTATPAPQTLPRPPRPRASVCSSLPPSPEDSRRYSRPAFSR